MLRYASFAVAQLLLSAVNNVILRCVHFTLKTDVCKCVRCLGRITLCRRTRSLILICLSRSRPSQCGALDDRLSAIHRVHSATRGCIAHMQRPYTRTIIPESPAAVAAALSTCCPQADHPTPGSLLSIRSRCARGRISFSRSVIRDENFSDGPRYLCKLWPSNKKKTWHFVYPGCKSCLFHLFILLEKTEIFSHFLKKEILLSFNIFSK